MEHDYYQVDNFLLSKEFNDEPECGRISFCFKSYWDATIEEHLKYVEEVVSKLLSEHDEEYTSWIRTATKTKEFYGALKFATVVNFRVRDAG